jgi:hypothetical protein
VGGYSISEDGTRSFERRPGALTDQQTAAKETNAIDSR